MITERAPRKVLLIKCPIVKVGPLEGRIAQWLAYLLPDPAAPGLIPCVPKRISEGKIVDVAEVNQ